MVSLKNDGSNTDKTDFVEVVPSDATAVALGGSFSIILKQDGSVLATGRNEEGQFGDGTTTSHNSFVEGMPSGSGVQSVAAGFQHTIISKDDGVALTAGSNSEGQLGSGTTTDSSSDTFAQPVLNLATTTISSAQKSDSGDINDTDDD